MSETTAIEWTDSTWSPIRVRVKQDAAAIARAKSYTSLVPIAERMAGRVGQHCEHVSPGCEHCYAETNNHRCLPGNGTGLPYDRRSRELVEAFVDEKALLQPFHWRWIRAASSSAVRNRRIFVENQSDLFGEWVPDELLDRVFAVMALCPEHVFQLLTKRPERMLAYVMDCARPLGRQNALREAIVEVGANLPEVEVLKAKVLVSGSNGAVQQNWRPLPNVWLGVSVENQAAADERIPLLLQTPAAVRFLSCEPLLGPVDISSHRIPWMWSAGLHWVIAGGESGPGARPMHPDWARGLRDQCNAAGRPFFFKQWGEWAPYNALRDGDYTQKSFMYPDGRVLAFDEPNPDGLDFRAWQGMARPGKKAAGGLLDGREWREFPEGRREG